MEEIKIKFKLRLNIPKWGKYVEGDEDYFYIDIFNESNGLVRYPIEKHWDIISYELVKNNGVLDDVSNCFLEGDEVLYVGTYVGEVVSDRMVKLRDGTIISSLDSQPQKFRKIV